MAGKFTRQLQESLLTVLVFDDTNCQVIRSTVELDLWDRAYEHLIPRIYDYIDKHKSAPGDHTADLFDDFLNQDDQRKARSIERLLRALGQAREGLNTEYVMRRLGDFVRRQAIRNAILDVGSIVQSGQDDRLDEVEAKLTEALRVRALVFDPGLYMSDVERVVGGLISTDDVFPTGAMLLDKYHAGPVRKGLHLLIGASGRGKSWWLIMLGTAAAIHRCQVLHVTLEMSERLVSQRYTQSFFAVAKANVSSQQTRFTRDPRERLSGFSSVDIEPKIALTDSDALKKLKKKLVGHSDTLRRIIIKQFPTGALTVAGLEAYLDVLESRDGFVPDLILVDYPDLMQIRAQYRREDTGRVIVDLRGLAVKRNCAVAVVSQSNRSGVGAWSTDERNVAEDFSKIATSDAVLVYRQTKKEAELGLARLYVSKLRSFQDKLEFVIVQDYNRGQFCVDAILMNDKYRKLVEVPEYEGDASPE